MKKKESILKKLTHKVEHFRDELKGRTRDAIVAAISVVMGLSLQSTIKTIADTIISKITPTSFSSLVKYTILYESLSTLLLMIICIVVIVFITKKK
jgi:hypothetical protein